MGHQLPEVGAQNAAPHAPIAGATLGDALVAMDAIAPQTLDWTRRRVDRSPVRLATALTILNGILPDTIARAEAARLGLRLIDPVQARPDARLIAEWGAGACIRDKILPWRRMGGAVLVLTSRPDEFARHVPRLTERFGAVRLAIAAEDRLEAAIAEAAQADLSRAAEEKVPAHLSSRTWSARRNGLAAAALALCGGLAMALAPTLALICLIALSSLVLLAFTALKAAALWAALQPEPPEPDDDTVVAASRPVVSVLVPLFREPEITGHLLSRLSALDYPAELLDICLVLEADDAMTRAAIDRATLPGNVRPIVVPHGALKTKPRALNYALDFTRGSIIGIYDAEDAPAPDQITKVVDRFARRGPEVVCLQGILDYYNTSANWMTRCFTLEYASWFRLMLPGIARLGLAIPLGGTTLFFRRGPLEELGGWDAHNVTEDADLGLRLARKGYRTELIEMVTMEEANGRVIPWIRQRSRWLKGYAMTYAVHIRRPRQLWRDLGAWRFWGVQVLFLGTVLQFTLAPVLWASWGLLRVLPIPMQAVWALSLLFLLSEVVTLATQVIGARRSGRPRLGFWAPTLLLYFPLGTAAMYKGLWELITKPFWWDKTDHGILMPAAAPQPVPVPVPVQSAVSSLAASSLSRVTKASEM